MTETVAKIVHCADKGLSITVTCSGPECDILDGFPGLSCVETGNELKCSNAISCDEGSTAVVSELTYVGNGDDFTFEQGVKMGTCDYAISSDGGLRDPAVKRDTCPSLGEDPCVPSANTTCTNDDETLLPAAGDNAEDTSSSHPHLNPSTFLLLFLSLFSVLQNGVMANPSPLLADAAFPDHPIMYTPRFPFRNHVERRKSYDDQISDFKNMWETFYRDTLKDLIKDGITGELDVEETLEKLFPFGWMIEIQDAVCSALVDYVIDPAIEIAGADQFFKKVLKPLTRPCMRKTLRFARKFRAEKRVRLAIVLAGGIVCEMIEDELIEMIPGHPDKLKDTISDVICGGDSDDCSGVDFLTDAYNCGKCKHQCNNGEKCVHGMCSMPYCNGMLFGSEAEPCSPECDCTSTQWGTGMCVKQAKCIGQITDECRDQDDCGEGQVCGMASGCDAFVCLNAKACEGQGPWLIPDDSEDEETSKTTPDSTPDHTPSDYRPTDPEPSYPGSGSVGDTSGGDDSSDDSPDEDSDDDSDEPSDDPPVDEDTAGGGSDDEPASGEEGAVGWVLALSSEEPTNYWINDWSEKDIFIDIDGVKSVQTRCVTVSETSYAALLPDSTKIDPVGNVLQFEPTPDSGPTACCFKWFADSSCTETSGKYGQLCGFGTAEFDFAVKSWKVYNCKGAWTGPPTS